MIARGERIGKAVSLFSFSPPLVAKPAVMSAATSSVGENNPEIG